MRWTWKRALAGPRGVAVVGASRNPLKLGTRVMSQLINHGYPKDRVFPVNPREREVMGRECYSSVKDIPEIVDIACIATPARTVPDILRDCADKGIKLAIIFSAGFSEVGNVELDRKIMEIVNEYGIRVCGPNSQGIISTYNNLCATFSLSTELPNTPIKGNVAIVSQSGGIGGSMLTHLWDSKVGISHFISTGNELDLSLADFVDFLAEDINTKVIILLFEVIKDVEKFKFSVENAKRSGKTIVALWVGRSKKARELIKYHTGLKPPEDGYEDLLDELEIITLENVEDLWDSAIVLSWQPPALGNRIGVISTSGALCSVITDLLEKYGLSLADFDEETRNRLRKILPEFSIPKNPIDMTGQIMLDILMMRRTLETLFECPEVDAILIAITTAVGPLAERFIKDIMIDVGSLRERFNKPLIVCWLASRMFSERAWRILLEKKIPVYPTPERAVRALKLLTKKYE
ncbi:MAG: acetate--CoA ligase family protein [Candidatus Baldrarchaeia archaeon]